jgi:hypothetical protein
MRRWTWSWSRMPSALGLACLLLGAGSLGAQSEMALPWHLGTPQSIVASVGHFEPIVGDGSSNEIGAELRFAPRRLPILPRFVPDLMPTLGVTASAQGALYAYGGLSLDIPLGERWTFTPGTGVGLLYRSSAKDLGGPLEFRSALELSYRLPNDAWIGICLYHLSNAGLRTPNPGSESLVLTYRSGLARLRR